MDILFMSFDNKYIKFAQNTIRTFRLYDDNPIYIHALNFSEEDEKYILSLAKNIFFINENSAEERLGSYICLRRHIIIADLLENKNIDKIIMMDADNMFKKSIKSIYELLDNYDFMICDRGNFGKRKCVHGAFSAVRNNENGNLFYSTYRYYYNFMYDYMKKGFAWQDDQRLIGWVLEKLKKDIKFFNLKRRITKDLVFDGFGRRKNKPEYQEAVQQYLLDKIK